MKHMRNRRGRWNARISKDTVSLSPLLTAFYRDGTVFFFLQVYSLYLQGIVLTFRLAFSVRAVMRKPIG